MDCPQASSASTQSSIVDWITEAANEVVTSRIPDGFEWIPEYSQYYSRNSGYFYDPITEFFYHPTTEMYYQLNLDTNQYDVVICTKKLKWRSEKIRKKAANYFGDNFQCLDQDGANICDAVFRIVDSVARKMKREENISSPRSKKGKMCQSSNDSPTIDSSESELTDDLSEKEEIDEKEQMKIEEGYQEAPLLRIIDGSNFLHVVTIEGARIGSAPNSDIVLKDVAKNVCELVFAEASNSFVLTSVYGKQTVLLNDYQVKDETREVEHGDTIHIGNHSLLVHVHHGMNTCCGCEPGLLARTGTSGRLKLPTVVMGETARRETLKALKASYGISDYEGDNRFGTGLNRAARRRKEVGSLRDTKDKADEVRPASGDMYANCVAKPIPGMAVAVPQADGLKKKISKENKGYALLKGMGWKEGQGLGKQGIGMVEPVKTEVKNNRVGLGAEATKTVGKSYKEQMLEKTRKRYEQTAHNEV